MVFKILKSSANFHGIAYNEKKVANQSAGHLYHENFGYLQDMENISKEDFRNYLIKYSSSNDRVKKPQFHATLSAKGKEHSFGELKEVAIQIMHGLGYKGNPILVYSHSDTDNNHIHIISSRVDMYGKKISDSNEGIRALAILDRILGIDHPLELGAAIEYAKTYTCSTYPQFVWLVESKGFKAIKYIDGYSFHKAGKKVGELMFKEIMIENKSSLTKKKRIRQLRAIIHKYKNKLGSRTNSAQLASFNRKESNLEFIIYLKSNLQLEFILFKNPEGKPYGYSIIDHQQKFVFKGSEVMPIEKLLEEKSHKNKEQLIEKKNPTEFTEPLINKANTMSIYEQDSSVGSIVDAELAGLQDTSPDAFRKKKKKRKRLRL